MMNEPWRRWIGTQYITGKKTQESIEKRFTKLTAVSKYAVGQWEICPSTERLHFQFYVELKKPMRMSGLKKNLYKDTHLKRATASREAGREYAMKTEHDSKGCRVEGTNPIEIGDWDGKQGQRNDLLAVKESIDSGMDESACWNEHFEQMVKHHKAFNAYRISTKKGRRDAPKIEILWGGPGSGKSAYCQLQEDLAGEEFYWLSAPADGAGRNSRMWWDGYNGESTVVIDEFYGWIPYSLLLRMLDRTSVQVEVKGGSVPLRATRFIFTSNTPPEQWYRLESKPYNGAPFLDRIGADGRWKAKTIYTGDITKGENEFLRSVLNIGAMNCGWDVDEDLLNQE